MIGGSEGVCPARLVAALAKITWIVSTRKAKQENSAAMKKAKARAILIDGKAYKKKSDGTLVPSKGKTDWTRLDRQTSAQVEDIAARDREGVPMSDAEWARGAIASSRRAKSAP